MKNISSILFAALFLLAYSAMSAQHIKLTSGSKTRTIKAGTFIEISLATPGQEPCNKCPVYGVRGRLASSTDGKISLAVSQSREPLMEEKTNVGYLTKNYKKKATPTLSFPVTDILSVTKKGKNKINKYSALQSVGMALTVIGFGHLISAPYVSQSDTKTANTLIGAGLAGMVSGIIINRTFRQKTFYTSESCPQKKPGKKIWVLN
ncbi:MAG: hypothetical protein ABJB16_02205 [Saprospiraceae bacterium]